MPEKQKKIAVIVLQYGNSGDTVECLESLLKLSGDFSVVIVDNNSLLKDRLPLRKRLTRYPSRKSPVNATSGNIRSYMANKHPVHYIEYPVNTGFAGGNNIGILFAKDTLGCDYFWLLNNDTTVDTESLKSLVACYEMNKKNRVGILGSKMRYYYKPEILQGVGGRMNPWFATSSGIGQNEKDTGQYDTGDRQVDFPIGASLFVSREFIDRVGMMTEDYFLYFEEMDWTIRAKRKGYRVGYCPGSIVYHKEGGSIGSSARGASRSALSDYYQLRNRIRFTARYRPFFLPTVILGFTAVILNRLLRGQWSRIPLVLKALFALPYRK